MSRIFYLLLVVFLCVFVCLKILPGTLFSNSRRGPQFFKTDEEVINRLSEDLERTVEKNEIKKMERVAYQSILGFLHFPMFEIKMFTGKIYYYSIKTDEVYEVEERKKWEKDKKGKKLSPWEIVPRHKKYITDSIADEVLVLKALKERDTEYR